MSFLRDALVLDQRDAVADVRAAARMVVIGHKIADQFFYKDFFWDIYKNRTTPRIDQALERRRLLAQQLLQQNQQHKPQHLRQPARKDIPIYPIRRCGM